MFNPLLSPICFSDPAHLSGLSAWTRHIPFALAVTAALRPRRIVELGTHRGDSYCAFCQAVAELELECECYAVDTWQGDEHAGLYGGEVLEDLRRVHDERFGRFSTLLPMTFDDAHGRFEDNTIDLLHIDGCHTYEAVSHDFHHWLPKLSSRGVVLFHDTRVEERDFGVKQFWDEIRRGYEHFELKHAFGLGVLLIGPETPDAVRDLAASAHEAAAFDRLFDVLGQRIELTQTLGNRDHEIARLNQEVQRLAGQGHEQAQQAQQLREQSEQHLTHYQQAAALVAAHEAALAEARGELAQRQAEIARLQENARQSAQQLAEREAQLQAAHDEAQRQQAEKFRVAGELASAQVQLAELHCYYGQLRFRAAERMNNALRRVDWLHRGAKLGARATRKCWRSAQRFRPGSQRNVMPLSAPTPGGSPPATVLPQEAASDYARFVLREQQNLAASRESCRGEMLAWLHRPRISVVVPVYNTPAGLLERAVESVLRQIYDNWELCLVDDASTDPTVADTLRRLAAQDNRIRLHFRTENGNISASTNDGIQMAAGEFVALLDHDDELTEDALFHVVRRLNERPDADVIYSDQDKISVDHQRSDPFFKPDWSPEYFRSVMYLGHLLVVRRSLLDRVGGCDSRFNGVQDYELALRLSEQTNRIEHIDRILYHWRAVPGSIALDGGAKANIDQLQAQAVQEHLGRMNVPADAAPRGGHRVQLQPRRRSNPPRISIMIPTRDRPECIGVCLQSLFEHTRYENFEVLVGDNETTDPAALAIFDKHPIRRIPLPGPFHFAAFNNRMASFATGEYLLLLNNDTEILTPDWLEHLLLYAEQPDVGAVGPLLTYADSTVQHAGVILGPRGTADHVSRGMPLGADGYAGSLVAAREVSAVTGACLLVSKEKYHRVGGLNELFHRHYEDVDFCLRLRSLGLRNIYVGATRLVHHESRSRGSLYDYTDRVLLLDGWERQILAGDPYYNRNFDPAGFDYTPRAVA